MIHINSPRLQPATDYLDNAGAVSLKGGYKPYELLHPECCGKPRYAMLLNIQCRYDGYSLWCQPEQGCKDAGVIAAKKKKEAYNRSQGQLRRYAK